ncbi:hypothetical protein HK097_002903 [Rhizophlyctis rosea]|uniref:SAP domain-containing protein n=1 Tax=Rhizophlyctis rosea TaxID=64517 RepID=A0AAD5WY59_9FUNG|nr:hypothetical protein HK097_002903 [Rhizophlyctis rosea]
MDPSANAALLEEVRTLTEHNVTLQQENAELRRLQSRASEAHTGHLEELASKLQENAGDLGAENARLRKMVEDLGRKLEREEREHVEQKDIWLMTEKKLREALRRERETVQDLKQLSTRQEEELNSLSATRSATPEILTRERGDSGVKLQEEITDLKIHVDNLTMVIETRDSQLARQDQEISELHSTIAALMDELETNYERVQFEGPIAGSLVGALGTQAWSYSPDGVSEGNTSDDNSSPSSSPVLRPTAALHVPKAVTGRRRSSASQTVPASPPTSALLTPPKTPPPTEDQPTQQPSHKRNKSKSKSPKKSKTSTPPPLSLPQNSLVEASAPSRSPTASPTPSSTDGHKKQPSASLGTLADELSRMNETAPVYSAGTFTGEPGSLKSRLAAYGLNTEGNRKILKKRLQAYVKRRQLQAQVKAGQQ